MLTNSLACSTRPLKGSTLIASLIVELITWAIHQQDHQRESSRQEIKTKLLISRLLAGNLDAHGHSELVHRCSASTIRTAHSEQFGTTCQIVEPDPLLVLSVSSQMCQYPRVSVCVNVAFLPIGIGFHLITTYKVNTD